MDRRNIDTTIKKKYVLETLKWCKSYFGINTRKRTKLKVNFSDKSRKIKNSIVFGKSEKGNYNIDRIDLNSREINLECDVLNIKAKNMYISKIKELEEKKIPFIIKRPLPNGGCEYWKLADLEILL